MLTLFHYFEILNSVFYFLLFAKFSDSPVLFVAMVSEAYNASGFINVLECYSSKFHDSDFYFMYL